MAYSITGMRRAPDVGFTSATRQTAEGAREIAVSFVADGLQEVEIRDAAGALRTLRELETVGQSYATDDTSIAARLSAL